MKRSLSTPLLSEAIRNWRHPKPEKGEIQPSQQPPLLYKLDPNASSPPPHHAPLSQPIKRSFNSSADEERRPIMLYRTPLQIQQTSNYSPSFFDHEKQPNSTRALPISSGQRIKLNLAPRSKPRELPPFKKGGRRKRG